MLTKRTISIAAQKTSTHSVCSSITWLRERRANRALKSSYFATVRPTGRQYSQLASKSPLIPMYGLESGVQPSSCNPPLKYRQSLPEQASYFYCVGTWVGSRAPIAQTHRSRGLLENIAAAFVVGCLLGRILRRLYRVISHRNPQEHRGRRHLCCFLTTTPERAQVVGQSTRSKYPADSA